jgi:hypothetical protein
MAFPTSVNDQITDSVTQVNTKVVAEAPAMALGSLYQSNAHALSLSFENAVNAQQEKNTLDTAVTTRCVNSLLEK